MSTAFSGSLHNKRRADLVEIAEALGLSTDSNIIELKDKISTHLDQNEAELSVEAKYRGLYAGRRRQHNESDSETPSGDAKAAIRTARKSLSRAVDRVQSQIDAAGIPLPETPIAQKVTEVANTAIEAATTASQALVENASQALVPTKQTQRQLSDLWRTVSTQVTKYAHQGQLRVDVGVKPVREFLSTPANLIAAFLTIELSHLLLTSSQSYNHTIFFPPPGGSSGSIDSLLHGVFSWAPKMQFTVRMPEWANWSPQSQVWGSISWWVIGTIVPALAASSILSLSHHSKHRGVTTRHQAQQQSAATPFDPFVFALIRFVLLLWPLTSAAPTALVDSLEMSGNLQGRALAAGLLVALVGAQQFSN